MVKIIINASEKVYYISKENIVITSEGISTLDGKGFHGPMRVYRINASTGTCERDVTSLCDELEKEGMPVYYKETESKQQPSDVSELDKIDSLELEELFGKEPETTNPLVNPFGFLANDKESTLSQLVDNFVNITWPDCLQEQSIRNQVNLVEGTKQEDAIKYLATEISNIKSVVNAFIEDVKNKL